jgi:hypothetical protein
MGLVEAPFGSRVLLLLFSELYMTATFVDGEFMVPVRDHPMAAKAVSICNESGRKDDHCWGFCANRDQETCTDLDWC